MPSEKERRYLEDILDNIELAQKFSEGRTPESLRDDLRTLYAVIRCLEIVSEASRRLSTDLKDRHTNIPWREAADAGNFYRHNYEGITSDRVWRTLQEDLPELKAVVEAELASNGKPTA
jgi:uncharacterized protein with HEPN domain